MLLFWIACALLTVGVVVALTRHLVAASRGKGQPVADPTDVEVYRDQLSEIEADKARGLISAAEAEAARIEIARRLLARADTSYGAAPAGDGPGDDAGARRASERIFMAVAGAVPALALALYLGLGTPGLPSQPAGERMARSPGAAPDIMELIGKVEAQLRANPGDGQGWDVVAPVYLRLERYRDAADAYQRAIDILGPTTRRLAGFAEATVLQSNGIVTEPARRAYARILEAEPGRVEARFGLALAMEQDGEIEKAAAEYRAMLAAAPPEAPWRGFVAERLAALAARTGAPLPKASGPQGEAAAAVAALPEAERREAILAMVEGLAARLKANGSDLAGWQRLLRSWSMLGQSDKAEAALIDARKALAGDDKALAELNAFARSLGLKS